MTAAAGMRRQMEQKGEKSGRKWDAFFWAGRKFFHSRKLRCMQNSHAIQSNEWPDVTSWWPAISFIADSDTSTSSDDNEGAGIGGHRERRRRPRPTPAQAGHNPPGHNNPAGHNSDDEGIEKDHYEELVVSGKIKLCNNKIKLTYFSQTGNGNVLKRPSMPFWPFAPTICQIEMKPPVIFKPFVELWSWNPWSSPTFWPGPKVRTKKWWVWPYKIG